MIQIQISRSLRVAVAALVCCAFTGCGKQETTQAGTGGGGAPAPVLVAEARMRDVPVQIRSIASVEPYSTVTVRSRVAGHLQKVHVAQGQDVKKDDLLFEIDARPFEIALHEAQAQRDRDEAMAKNAQLDSDRMAGLLKNQVATQEEADKMRFAAEAARATVRADESSIASAQLQVDYTRIRSALDGRAGKLLADEGNVIKADDTSLMVINQIAPIYVSFAVPEQDLEAVRKFNRPGHEPVVDVITPPDSEVSESGKLSFVDNTVDTETGTIRLRATFENTDRRLWPGQFVQATLNLTVEKNQTVVPTRAIQVGQQGKFVFVLKPDMTVDMRAVTVGRVIDEDSVIDSGITAGERVVTEGQLRLAPGSKVAIKTSSTTAPATKAAAS